MFCRCLLFVGSLLLEVGYYSWKWGELPSFPGAILDPHRPTDHAGLDGQKARYGCGRSPLVLAAGLCRGHAVAYITGSVTTQAFGITFRLS